jgi:diaminopimelate decarboxylase
MHEFIFKRKALYCESVRVNDAARRFGTPLYLYSYRTLIDHYEKLRDAFRKIHPLICYSVKANSNLTILKTLVGRGAGLDIVSGGELFRALKAGCAPSKIVYASVGKTEGEIEAAIRKSILFFNVESFSELLTIERIAKKLRKTPAVAIRINPDVEPKTHKFITTGKLTNKFGIDFDTARAVFASQRRFPHIAMKGLHIHIGSQITESAPYIAAITKMADFIASLKRECVDLEYLNIGGGLGIKYNDESPQTAVEFASKVMPLLDETGLKIILEPGRFIVGQAGILVVKVLYIKKTPLKKFIIVDGGMNDLIRPALYDAYHAVVPLSQIASGALEKADVVGPICESGDFFAKDRLLPIVKEGDYLAVMSAGAYGFSMASNYNSRLRSAEVMAKGSSVHLIRRRESYQDLVKNEGTVKL